MIAITAIVFIGAWFFFERTIWGKAFEAVAIDRRAAALVGINLNRVTALAFTAGGAIAALAGLLQSPLTSASYVMGLPIAIKGFAALVIGGIGRVEGALLGGVLLAAIEKFVLRYAPIPSGFAIGCAVRFDHSFFDRSSDRALARPRGTLMQTPRYIKIGPRMVWLLWLLGAALLVGLAFALDGYLGDIYRKLLLTATLALGFNFLFGIAGQVAFSHIAFYGLGAYLVIILYARQGWPLGVAIAVTIVAAALIALIVAVPSTRLEGFYLALATLAFAQLFIVVLLQGGELTGGAQGLTGYRLPDAFGIELSRTGYELILVALFLGTLAVLMRLDHSYFGHACRAIRDNPEAAAAMGIDVSRTQGRRFLR